MFWKNTFLFLMGTLLVAMNAFCQKQPLDLQSFKEWESIAQRKISNNGKYIAYTVVSNNGSRIHFTSADKKPDISFCNPDIADFEVGNKFGVVQIKDTLIVVNLEDGTIRNIANVERFKCKGSLLAYQQITGEKKLLLENLVTGLHLSFNQVSDYYLINEKELILVSGSVDSSAAHLQQIQWVNLHSGDLKTLWKGRGGGAIVFNADNSRFAFVARENGKDTVNALWVYFKNTGRVLSLINDLSFSAGSQLTIHQPVKFNLDNAGIFFSLKINKNTSIKPEMPGVDIWNYQEKELQSQQQFNAQWTAIRNPLAYLNFSNNKFFQVNSDSFPMTAMPDHAASQFVLLSKSGDDDAQSMKFGWPRQSAYLLSLHDGSKKCIVENASTSYKFSPDGKFIIWYDRDEKQYYSYEISTGTKTDISRNIPFPVYDDEYDRPEPAPPFGTGGWFESDKYMLVYDRYDIWRIDPKGSQAPVNITRGLGRKKKQTLRMIHFYDPNRNIAVISGREDIIVKAFDQNDKRSGFYSLDLRNKKYPVLLSMDPCYYDEFNTPLKAKNSSVVLLTRMTPGHCDIYWTTDFKSFSQISNTNPQQGKYNWLTSELLRWKPYKGDTAEGILYKPENFDPNKKYPVIFYTYETLSDELFKYHIAEPSQGALPIAYFVSNGYIVFEPDIKFEIGYPGRSVYNYVVSAAEFLAKKSWIDSTRMGYQGHSWGGYEVADLISRTNIFRAACAAALQADFVSGYNNVRDDGVARHFHYETGQNRIGATLWERPDLYLENSPIFRAPSVNTPLLIMHNKQDGVVPFTQGLEYYLALWRLNKKVWLLQYDGEGHTIDEPVNSIDFTIRLKQFFDHYLKYAPAPQWMTRGVPARLKQIENGYFF